MADLLWAMTSYLQAWWYGSTTAREEPQRTLDSRPPSLFNASFESSAPRPVPTPEVSMSISSPEETQAAIDIQVDDIEDDTPPAFPSRYSIQRSSGSAQGTRASASSDQGIMPPPPLPLTAHSSPFGAGDISASLSTTRLSRPATASTTSLRSLPSSNTLSVPSITRGSASTLKPPPTTARAPQASSKRQKVVLTPGHSPLDWAALKASGQDLRVGTFSLTPMSHRYLCFALYYN